MTTPSDMPARGSGGNSAAQQAPSSDSSASADAVAALPAAPGLPQSQPAAHSSVPSLMSSCSSTATADAEAREWWARREATVERELYSGLLKRMDTQRKQVIAFKAEQSKWESRLQGKIKKDAHDRKLLGEYNLELQAALAAFEDRFAHQQREVDAQTSHIVALESTLREKAAQAEEVQLLRRRNAELAERVAKWERYHRAEAAAAERTRQLEQEALLNHLEHNLLTLSLGDSVVAAAATSAHPQNGADKLLTRRRSAPDGRALRRSDSNSSVVDEEDLLARIAELEKLCKHKDQSIHSLKGILERQEAVLDEKLKLTNAKYDQVKAINLALQKRLLQSLTDNSP
ncbi:hypothetical protein PybrP1_008226 [[Pythium] brassicae (nom. inval.)]|nr:hypothetical protein PybrP1_008226 [[Pythium] brassicae (nom. inval.)]